MKEKFKKICNYIFSLFKPTRNMRLSNEEFKEIFQFFGGTYQFFLLNKIGHREIGKKPYEKIYTDFLFMWDSFLVSLRSYYLINFAKFFDKPSYCKGQKITLSVFRAIPKLKFSLESRQTINKIILIRRELVAHIDADAFAQGKKLEEHYGLDFKGEIIKSLVKETFELLNQIKNDYGYSDNQLTLSNAENYTEAKFDEWYSVFKKT